jgi:hypothetical protein
MAGLQAGRWVCEVDEALLEAARPRCHFAPFLAQGEPRLRLRQLPALGAQAHLFHPQQRGTGAFQLEQEGLAVEVPLEVFPAEFALRAIFQLAILRQGGLTLHASAVAFGEAGLVALGPSGAGKSTLARLCVQSEGAELLSDELVAVLPDGSVHGSPFRSEPDLRATRLQARVRAFLLLRKGAAESLEPLPPFSVVTPLLGQVFRGSGELDPGREALARVGQWVESIPAFRLTFRKDPAVATFLEEWVHGLSDSAR